MGAWGVGLFSDDLACDVRDHYRELLEDGIDDHEATRLTVEKFRAYLDETDGVGLLALAVTQSKLGRLEPDIRDRSLAVLDRGADLETWERDNPKLLSKRRATLEKARAQLTGQQPPRRRLRPPKRISSGLTAGDVLAFELPGRVVLLRVVRVRQHRLGETPVLEELTVEGAEVSDRRFHAFVMQQVDWQRAGFRRVQKISVRAGDEQAPLPAVGISWAQLAERYRRRSAQ